MLRGKGEQLSGKVLVGTFWNDGNVLYLDWRGDQSIYSSWSYTLTIWDFIKYRLYFDKKIIVNPQTDPS